MNDESWVFGVVIMLVICVQIGSLAYNIGYDNGKSDAFKYVNCLQDGKVGSKICRELYL